MKYWVIIVIVLIGLMITIVGALFKIMHWPGASLMLIVGMGLKALGILLLLIKVVMARNSNSLLKQ
ncbi:GldL-related protein [Flavobacterium sp.]|uniref:GldL-related protein n=1 Tax=Flavobacterium sp. TaxID=239 RepID=UPI004034AE37